MNIKNLIPPLFLKSLSEYKGKLALLVLLLLANTLTDGFSVIMILPVLQAVFGGSSAEITNDYLRGFIEFFNQEIVTLFPGGDKVIVLLAVLLFIFLVKALFSLYSKRLLTHFPEEWLENKRIQVMKAYMESDYYFFSQQSHGNLMNTIMLDCRLGSICIRNFLGLVSNVLIAVILTVALLLTNFRITLVLLAITPVIFLISYRYIHSSSKEAGKKRIAFNQNIWHQINQNINGMQKVWTLRLEDKKLEELSAVQRDLTNLNARENFKQGVPSILAPLLIVIILAICILYFKFFSEQGPGSQVSIIALFIIISNRLFSTFSSISSNYVGFIKGASNLIDIEQRLQKFQKKKRNVSGIKISEINQPIVFENVSFKYPGTKPIFDNVSFEIPHKETTLIVGESGAGKSTLINLILGFLEPTDGVIKINGRDLQLYNHKHLLARFGFVSQDVFLFNDSIYNNFQYYDANADIDRMNVALDKAGLKIDSDKFSQQLNTSVGERGVRLSGGEKQRISLASSFLQNPDIYIFDEPTSSLDVDTEEIVINTLKSIKREKTSIIISHNLRFKEFVDNVFSIKDGQIIREKSVKS